MRKLFLFMNVSLDGYVEAPGHDLSWAKNDFEAFSAERSRDVDAMLFGRRTYEMMKNFWPSPQAREVAPEVAQFMNERRKYVASRQPFDPGWGRVTMLSGDAVAAVKKLKEGPGGSIIMLGSNTLCASLMAAGLVDEFQVLVNPVVLGEGTSLVKGLPKKIDLDLTDIHRFDSGTVLLTYTPNKGK
jgi:dihydrofolate reductase